MVVCPICKSAAEEIEAEPFDGKTLRCPKHGEFEVATAVLTSRPHMLATSKHWETALKKATESALTGTRPRILKYDFHDLPPQPD